MSLLFIFLVFQVSARAQESQSYVAHYSYRSSAASVYKDPTSGVVLYIETDGRHVAAISSEGKLLWTRAPFEGLPYYRVKDPQVSGIGPLSKWDTSHGSKAGEFVAVFLANSQFGLLRLSDGEFKFQGQD
jgi:hypothetical protein